MSEDRDTPFTSSDLVLAKVLSEWKIPPEKLESVYDAAERSFKSVKDLTEYEDAKAARLLTVIAFLTAALAAVFNRFSTAYVWPLAAEKTLSAILIATSYILFFLYLLVVTAGVALVFRAISPRFNVPKTWKSTTNRPKSMLFFMRILDVSSEAWADSFRTLSKSDELKETYAKNYIFESRLIAEKVAIKIRFLEGGLVWIKASLWVLFAFFLICGLTFAFAVPLQSSVPANTVKSSPSPSPTPTKTPNQTRVSRPHK